jgi:hypothetical protein
MLCRRCGIEIADKAIVCYRCGTATTEPKFKPPVPQQRVRSVFPTLVIVVAALVAAAGLLTFGYDDPIHIIGAAASGIVAVVIVLMRYRGRWRNGKLSG